MSATVQQSTGVGNKGIEMTFSFHPRGGVRKHGRAIWWVLCVICLLLWQPFAAFAQTSVQRDQQALAVLQQVLVAGGGQGQLSSIQDLTRSGTVTYSADDPITASVTIKSRGQQVKVDTAMPDGQRIAIVDGGGGLQAEPNGTLLQISNQSAFDFRCMVFPYLSLADAAMNSSITVIYIGLVSHSGASLLDIRLQESVRTIQYPQGNRSVREAHDFYIDPNTFLVVAVSDRFYAGADGSQGLAHEIQFSNYQTENGISLPMTVVETIDGVTAVTMQLNQAMFNTGLSDSDFSL